MSTLTFTNAPVNLSADQAQRAEQGVNDKDLVSVAAAVYDATTVRVGTWSRLTDDQVAAAGIEPARLNNRASGFKAGLYANESHHALAFAGTDATSLADWETNLGQGLGLATSQYQEAVALAIDAKGAFGDRLILTGHSLGGGLATAAAAAIETHAVVFNPAGVHSHTYEREGISPDRARAQATEGQVRNYIVAGEILNAVQTFLPVPRPAGQTVVLPDPAPLRPVLRLVPGAHLVHAISLHGMAAVEKAFTLHETAAAAREGAPPRVSRAEPGKSYSGPITKAEPGRPVQQLVDGKTIEHDRTVLFGQTALLKAGNEVQIHYRGSIGQVADSAKNRKAMSR